MNPLYFNMRSLSKVEQPKQGSMTDPMPMSLLYSKV